VVLHFPATTPRHAGARAESRVSTELRSRAVDSPSVNASSRRRVCRTRHPAGGAILELALTLLFNRGRLMVLPIAVAKSTGLRQAPGVEGVRAQHSGDWRRGKRSRPARCVRSGRGGRMGQRGAEAIADEIAADPARRRSPGYMRRLADQPRLSAAQMGRRRPSSATNTTAQKSRLRCGAGRFSWLASLLWENRASPALCEQLILQGLRRVVDPEGDTTRCPRPTSCLGGRSATHGARAPAP
jgi:hypothetical protein